MHLESLAGALKKLELLPAIASCNSYASFAGGTPDPRKRVTVAQVQKSIYSRYFPLNSQGKEYSFSPCDPVNLSFSFHHDSWLKS